MATINKRVFGTPITGVVRDKLEARQGETKNLQAGESLEGRNIARSNYDYASKLPFVRMWTSVKIIESADIEILEEIPASKVKDPSPKSIEKLKKQKADKFGTVQSKVSIEEIKDRNGKPIKYIIRGANRDQMNYTRKTYEIGNHNYLKNYGEVNPNNPVVIGTATSDTDNTQIGEEVTLEAFPNELEKNPLMKPQSGITSISSETEGGMGLIKKTTVNFIVHNFRDFDKIFSKYFLSPGAQIFVDFGFANIPNLYRPSDLIQYSEQQSEGLQGFLYDEKTGFITQNQGDVEVLQGIVVDYNSKIRPDGGVDCSVTLTSKNSALLSFSTDENIVMRVKSILTRGILYLGLRAVVTSGDVEDKDGDLKSLMSTPNANSTADTIETYNKNLQLLAKQELSGRSGPEGNAIRTGVFVENLNADNTYIAWGLFEDLIINSQFGFGKDNDDIVDGKNLQVKMNSSNSYTRWTNLNKSKQHVLQQVPEDSPFFMYPAVWAPTIHSYSFQKKKLPEIIELDTDGNVVSRRTYYDDSTGDKLTPEEDKELGRIPIREVFINVDMIVKAFEANSDVKKVIQEILDELNKEADGLFDWRMKEGETDAEIEIIDANYTISTENQKLKIEEEPFFTFNIQSPNSMVKDYNLEFKLPSGNVGNMYAIQGLGVGDTLFSTNPDVQEAVAAGCLDKDLLKIIYEPDMGNYRAKQLLDEPKVDSETFNVFREVDNLFDTNVYKIKTTSRPSLVTKPLTNKSAVTRKKENQPTLSGDEIIKNSDESLEASGFKVAKTFKEYFKYRISSKIQTEIPNLLPYNLSLTIAGIASLQVGDTFKVDYLPQRYIENSYLQITKVSHDIGPGGWFTTLDTQFRLLPNLTDNIYSKTTTDKVRLSPSALMNVGFEDQIEADAGFWSYGNDVKIADLAPYMTDIKILYNEKWAYDYELYFRVNKGLSGEIKDESGIIKNARGNFYAEWNSSAKRNSALRTGGTKFYDGYGRGLGHSYHYEDIPIGNDRYVYRVWPPDFKIIPGFYYIMFVWGDKIAIMQWTTSPQHPAPYYKQIRGFFQKYVGKQY